MLGQHPVGGQVQGDPEEGLVAGIDKTFQAHTFRRLVDLRRPAGDAPERMMRKAGSSLPWFAHERQRTVVAGNEPPRHVRQHGTAGSTVARNRFGQVATGRNLAGANGIGQNGRFGVVGQPPLERVDQLRRRVGDAGQSHREGGAPIGRRAAYRGEVVVDPL